MRRRLQVRSQDPGLIEWLIVIGITAFVIATSLLLSFSKWLILGVIGFFVAKALGYNPWIGVAVSTAMFLLVSLLRGRSSK